MSGSHKHTIEKFTQTVNSHHVHHLDKVLADNVEKKHDSKVVFTNLQEAREYYSMEHEANPSAQWTILHIQLDDQNKDIAQATITYNNHTYQTRYTFNAHGKIETINSHLEQQQ